MSKQKKETPRCGLCQQVNPVANHKKVCPARFDKIVPRDQDISLAELAKSQKAIKDAKALKATEVWADKTTAQFDKLNDILAKPSGIVLAEASKTELVGVVESAIANPANPAERAALEEFFNAKYNQKLEYDWAS